MQAFRKRRAAPTIEFVNLNMTIVLLSILLVGLAFAGIAIKILVKKDGQFAGTCSSNNPLLKDESGVCGMCGARPEERCKADEGR